MTNKLSLTFKKEKKIVIGMIHFPPLLGYKDFPGIDVCLELSLQDAKTLEQCGVDGLMVENNYDTPHKAFVDPETVALMTYLTKEIVDSVSVPVGVNVLWNDYRAALSIAKVCSCKFIRVPVFVDSVRTQYGEIMAEPEKVLAFREEINASDVALFTDIHVKHAKMLEKKTISESAKEAIEKGSDAIIITGKWTGDAPDVSDLKEAREAAGKNFPILIGSGATKENANTLLQYANGVIVATSLKTGEVRSKEEEVNLKPWQERISLAKTKEFMKKVSSGGTS